MAKNEINDNDDFLLDPLWDKLDKKPKIHSGHKGDRGEKGVIKLLTERFGLPFSRVPDSGAFASHAALPEELKSAYVGDIICPVKFKWCIECKNGYDEDISIDSIMFKGRSMAQLDSFLEQATKDANRIGKKPLLCWKKTGKPYLAFTHEYKCGEYWFAYRDWFACPLVEFLKLPDDVFISP
jgi:hypothetical protein